MDERVRRFREAVLDRGREIEVLPTGEIVFPEGYLPARRVDQPGGQQNGSQPGPVGRTKLEAVTFGER